MGLSETFYRWKTEFDHFSVFGDVIYHSISWRIARSQVNILHSFSGSLVWTYTYHILLDMQECTHRHTKAYMLECILMDVQGIFSCCFYDQIKGISFPSTFYK